MSKKLAWSCDERDQKECRNAHGCHCQEITHLLARKSAPRGSASQKTAERPPSSDAEAIGADCSCGRI
jgi:hypothetical protein